MKPKIIYALAISCLFLVSGCGSAQPENQSISLEEAKSAALDDAQLGIDEVEFLKTERNTDGDTSYYDIQFLVNGTIYKYQINTETGAILHVDNEAESAFSDTNTPEASAITLDQARAIALDHAGISEGDATFVKEQTGTSSYEIEFYSGSNEYDYEIDKATGAILNVDRDAEDYTPPQQNGLTLDEARTLALSRVSGATERHIEIERDEDDGHIIYEGEIHYGNAEYEFEIDAASGTILEWTVDYEDD